MRVWQSAKNTGLMPGILLLAVIYLLLMTNLLVTVHFDGEFEGLFLLKDSNAGKLILADHLFVGNEQRVIFDLFSKTRFTNMDNRLFPAHGGNADHLHVEWNPKGGSGIVSNHFKNGTALVTYLGRYLDDDEEVHGLFVGGGLPETVKSNVNYNMNNSGMTYYDGKRWFHIWCSVNEGIGHGSGGTGLTPSKWEFLGSRLVKKSDDNVVITSSHQVLVDKVPLRIDRRMSFTAGEPYLNLEITITNVGKVPVSYAYSYGDEPWVGYYGTSLGDVGWTRGRIINHEESIDPHKYSYVGMADIGNRVIGENPVYTNLADFIEWFGPELPDHVYFTNNLKHMPEAGKPVPLESNERFIGVEWGRRLAPNATSTLRLAVGMAVFNPQTGIPEKPPTSWK